MSVLVTWNGATFIVPTTNDVGWGSNLTDYLVAIAAGALQKTGGNFTLSADVDFGPSFGLKSAYYILPDSGTNSVTLEAPTTVTSSYTLKWPDTQGLSNQFLTNDGSGNLSWTNATGTGTVNSGTQYQLAYYATSTNVISGNSSITTNVDNQLLVPDGSQFTPSFSFTTAPDTGMYFEGFGRLAVATAGVPALRINSSQQFLFGNGTAALPSISFNSEPNTGIIHSVPNSLAISVFGTNYYQFTTTGLRTSVLSSDAFFAQSSVPGGILGITIDNQSNTASSDSRLYVQVAGSSAGDPFVQYNIDSITSWVTGIDNSDSDNFKISASSVLGTNDVLVIPSSGAVQHVDGTDSLPSITFISDPDSGMYSAGANILGFAVNGAQGLKIGTTFVSSERSASGSTISMGIENTSNTANSSAQLSAYVAGSSAGDAQTQYLIQGGVSFTEGIDNSTTDDDWVLSRSATLGTDNAISVSGNTGAVSIRGSSTNDSAAAGFVGETVTSGSPTITAFPATGTYGDLESINLTAGDWLVTGTLVLSTEGTTTAMDIGISTTSGNSTAGLVYGDNHFRVTAPTGSTGLKQCSLYVPSYRVSLSATTTHYLKFEAIFSAGGPTGQGRISAVRIR